MTDHGVSRIYEAATLYWRARATSGREVPSNNLDGFEGEVLSELLAISEELHLKGSDSLGDEHKEEPVEAERMKWCLTRLSRSLEKATKRGGQRGYLQFIASYVQ